MPGKLEIKGLGLAVQNTRRSIAVLRSEIAGLNADSWDLQKTVQELREQIKQTHDDLKFEAENLGNEAGGDGEPDESPHRNGPSGRLPERRAEAEALHDHDAGWRS